MKDLMDEDVFNIKSLPEHMQDGVTRYLEHGIEPGSFMLAVLRNDLVGAFGAADQVNASQMATWASWLYNDCPAGAWGSDAKVADWMAQQGFNGFAAEPDFDDAA